MLSPVQTWLLEGESVPAGHSQLKPPKPWPLARSLQSHLWHPGPCWGPAILLSVNVWTCVLLEHRFSGRADPLNSMPSFPYSHPQQELSSRSQRPWPSRDLPLPQPRSTSLRFQVKAVRLMGSEWCWEEGERAAIHSVKRSSNFLALLLAVGGMQSQAPSAAGLKPRRISQGATSESC